MAAASHRYQHVPLTGESDGVDNVGGAAGSHLQRWASAVHGIIDRSVLIAFIRRCEYLAPYECPERIELAFIDLGGPAIQHGNDNRHGGPSRSCQAESRASYSSIATDGAV